MIGQNWFYKLWDRRSMPRLVAPPVSASYWNGVDAPEVSLRDIGMGGAFIRTPDKWHRGTDLHIQFTMDGCNGEKPASLGIWASVTRCVEGGIAVQFAARDVATRQALRRFLEAARRRQVMQSKKEKTEAVGGQALIEFVLIFPLLFLLIVNVVNFGGFLYAWITVANAARAGAQYMAMGGATVTAPEPATDAQIDALVRLDLVSLPEAASAEVRICRMETSGTTCTGSGGKALPTEADPDPSETGLYERAVVDVTYQYQPFIPLWSFPALGVGATLPPTTIRAQSVMRMLQ